MQADLMPAIRTSRVAMAPATAPGYDELMRGSRFPADLRSTAFAGVISQALAAHRRPLIRGMTERSFQALMRSCFPGHDLRNGWRPSMPTSDADEFDDLLNLLLEHRAYPGEASTWLSCAIASASMYENHLWQDMGLPNRPLLSQLLRENYPALAARNTGDMKWKKFFYRQLCERAGVLICKSPNCRDCCDYSLCFSTEAREESRIEFRRS
jgi:nitrogen fixation protein NifQ